MEVMVVLALIALIGGAILVLVNPLQQTQKARNVKRKHDLDVMRKIFEEWYTDKGCYPKPSDVCYDAPKNICTSSQFDFQTCSICGLETTSPVLKPYLAQLPCDPKHGAYEYVYQPRDSTISNTKSCSVDAQSAMSSACPEEFVIYTKFEYAAADYVDSDSVNSGCSRLGCGLNKSQAIAPTPAYGFDYVVTSPNKSSVSTSNRYYCISNGICNECGTDYKACLAQSGCTNKNSIYPSLNQCCSENSGACH